MFVRRWSLNIFQGRCNCCCYLHNDRHHYHHHYHFHHYPSPCCHYPPHHHHHHFQFSNVDIRHTEFSCVVSQSFPQATVSNQSSKPNSTLFASFFLVNLQSLLSLWGHKLSSAMNGWILVSADYLSKLCSFLDFETGNQKEASNSSTIQQIRSGKI